jgi:heat-inducible transcriptional repressor
MSDLEEMGLILQPHTSAGRIPSDAGYRLYVDRMLDAKDREVAEMKEMMIQRQDRMELLLKQLARVLATNTNYAAMISGPQFHQTKLKFIQLSIVSDTQILAVIVAEGNVVRNKMIEIEHGLDQQTVLELNILLNSALNGLTLQEINLGTITKLKEQAGIHGEVVSRVLDAVGETIHSVEDVEIYTSGATNIFKYPELSSSEKASELISAFEDKQDLVDMISSDDGQETGIQVYIGQETPIPSMQDCSVVTATYEIGDGMYGRIGVIGPKRMDYEKVVNTMKTLMAQLDQIFKDR